MLKNSLDPALLRSTLSRWLSENLDGEPDVRLTDLAVPDGSGLSCETVVMQAIVGDGQSEKTRGFVARIAPVSGGIFRVYDFVREAKIMASLARGTNLPVPDVIGHEADPSLLGAQFLMLERHYGRVPGDDPIFTLEGWVTELSDGERATMFDSALQSLAGIANADWRALGLTGLERQGEGSILERELAYWSELYDHAAAGHSYPTLDAALEWLQRNRPAERGGISLSWGDARFGNLMFSDDCRVSAILDWEVATMGPRELDLGTFLFMNRAYTEGCRIKIPGGFPEPAEAVARYEELSGHEVHDMHWYEALAGFRASTLTMRATRLLVDIGVMPPDSTVPSTNSCSVTLASMLDLPAPGGEVGWYTGRR